MPASTLLLISAPSTSTGVTTSATGISSPLSHHLTSIDHLELQDDLLDRLLVWESPERWKLSHDSRSFSQYLPGHKTTGWRWKAQTACRSSIRENHGKLHFWSISNAPLQIPNRTRRFLHDRRQIGQHTYRRQSMENWISKILEHRRNCRRFANSANTTPPTRIIKTRLLSFLSNSKLMIENYKIANRSNLQTGDKGRFLGLFKSIP